MYRSYTKAAKHIHLNINLVFPRHNAAFHLMQFVSKTTSIYGSIPSFLKLLVKLIPIRTFIIIILGNHDIYSK